MSQLSKSRIALKQIRDGGLFLTDLEVAFSLDWLINDIDPSYAEVDKKLLKEKQEEVFDMAKSLFEKANTGEWFNSADTAVCAAYLAHKAVEGTNIEPYDILDVMEREQVFYGSDEDSTVSLRNFDKDVILKAYKDEVECQKEMAKEDVEDDEVEL